MRSRGAVGNATWGPDGPEAKALGLVAATKLAVEIAASFSMKVRRVREYMFGVARPADCTTGRDPWPAFCEPDAGLPFTSRFVLHRWSDILSMTS
jgi:hypothetical protein